LLSLVIESMKYLVGAVLTAALFARAAAPGFADDAHDTEAQIGAQVYQQLQQKGEIVPRSAAPAEYALLDPIASRIARVANPQYGFPFDFIVVHEKAPNAFAVPGGHVYVTDALLRFVQNKEELAGVLCHETSHDIHHDVINNNAKDQRLGSIIGIIGAVTGMGRSGFGQTGEQLAYTLQSQGYSRAVETNADQKGAQTCAAAGYNPWGMVWLFENFEKADTGGSMEALSDHPNDSHRIADLQREFAADPAVFGRFSSNIASATPLHSTRTGVYASAPNARVTHPTTPAARRGYCCSPRGTASGALPSVAARRAANAPAQAATRPNGGGTTIGADGTITGH